MTITKTLLFNVIFLIVGYNLYVWSLFLIIVEFHTITKIQLHEHFIVQPDAPLSVCGRVRINAVTAPAWAVAGSNPCGHPTQVELGTFSAIPSLGRGTWPHAIYLKPDIFISHLNVFN